MKTSSRIIRLAWLIGFLVLISSGAGAGWVLRAGDKSPAPHAADETQPERGVVCFGHVDVEGGVSSLYPLQPGRVVEVIAREAMAYKKGDLLLRLDDVLATQRFREAEADLQAAQAQRDQASKLPEQHEAQLAQQREAIEAITRKVAAGRHELQRKRELHAGNHLHAELLHAAEELVKEGEAGIRAEKAKLRLLELQDPTVGIRRAEADVAAKQARLEQARKGIEECHIVAPADGHVFRVLVGVGEVLGPQPVKPALSFCPDGPRIIRAEVEQEFAHRVRVGHAAMIRDDTTTSDQAWQGKVVRVSDWYTHRRSILQEPLQFNDVRTLECILELDPNQPPLRVGQRVRVTVGKVER